MTKPNFCSQFDEALKHRVDETGTLSFTINSLYYLRRIYSKLLINNLEKSNCLVNVLELLICL